MEFLASEPDSHGWTLDRRVYLSSVDEMDYIMKLAEQSYRTVL